MLHSIYLSTGVPKNWSLSFLNRYEYDSYCLKEHFVDQNWVKICEMPLNAQMGQEKPYTAEILKTNFFGTPFMIVFVYHL